MNNPDEPPLAQLERLFLLLLVVSVSLAFAWILLPFYGTILWAAVIALLFAPLHRWLLLRLNGRRTSAALLTLLVAVIIVVIPLATLTAALASEAAGLYGRLQSGELQPGRYLHGIFDALPGWVTGLLDRVGLVDFDTMQRRLTAALAQGIEFIATQAFSLGQITFEFVAKFLITLYLAFFLIRDGDRLARAIASTVPLVPDHQRVLRDTFTTVIRATVKGNLVVAAIQGALGGLAFWVLGVHAALLGGVLMACLSLLPAAGAALVWGPVAIWFFVGGAVWHGVAIVAWGVLVIGLIDNLLRPVLVGNQTRMPDFVVMITTLGGLAVFGLNGFVLGPAIAAMFIAVWRLYSHARAR